MQLIADQTGTVTRAYGAIRITVNRTVCGGYTIGVYANTSPHRYEELSYSTGDRDLYRARYATIRDLALQGLSGDEIAERINQPAAQVVAEAERVVNTALADLHAIGRRRQLPATRTGAEYRDLTPAQMRARDAAVNGVIVSGNGIHPATLRALARKGHGHITCHGPIGARYTKLTLKAVAR